MRGALSPGQIDGSGFARDISASCSVKFRRHCTMDDRTVDLIFAGSLESLPPVSSKIVRIFTSSTFTGLRIQPSRAAFSLIMLAPLLGSKSSLFFYLLAPLVRLSAPLFHVYWHRYPVLSQALYLSIGTTCWLLSVPLFRIYWHRFSVLSQALFFCLSALLAL
jgi:hypothetical protein